MAKKQQKRTNKFVVFLGCLLAVVLGTVSGFLLNNYVFGGTMYVIPDTTTTSSGIATGDINVDVIKSKDLSIHFVELGNKYTGDCTFIKVGSVEILIDAGSRADSVTPIYNYISPYIEGALDYVIVTHAHQDHYAGFSTGANVPSLFDKLRVGTVITFAQTNQKDTSTLYKNFLRELEETKDRNGTVVYNAYQCYNETDGAQRVYDLGNNVELEILTHRYYTEKAQTENDYSVCCIINQTVPGNASASKHYLFTGDLESGGEESLVTLNTLPKVELYKAGHHGSKTSSSAKLLKAIQPKVVCVCACAGSSEYTKTNANQFPTQAFVDRVAPYTSDVYVTTLCIDYNKGEFTSMNGNIVLTSDLATGASALSVNMYFANNATKLKDTDWFKANRTCPKAWAS